MVTEAGLDVEFTADIRDFDTKLQAAKARLLSMDSAVNRMSGASFPKFQGSTVRAAKAVDTIEKVTRRARREQSLLEKAVLRSGNALATESGRAKTFATQANKATMHSANLAAQFNDIGVMMASGQSPFILAVQQGTQISQVLNQLGTSGASRLETLKASIRSFLSPVSILTVAVIAGAAALVQWGVAALKADEEATGLAKRLETARERIEELNLELRQLEFGVTSEELALMDEIVEKQKELVEAKKLEAKLASSGFDSRLRREQVAMAQENVQAIEAELAGLRKTQAAIEEKKEAEREIKDIASDTLTTLESITKEHRNAVIAARDHRKEVMDSASEFAKSQEFMRIGAAEALVMSQNVTEISKATQKSVDKYDELVKEIGKASVTALQFAGIDITSGVDAAAKAAAILAGQLGVSLERARQLQGMTVVEAMGENMPGGFGGPMGPHGPRPIPRKPGVSGDRGVVVNPSTPKKTPKGAAPKENPLFAKIEQLRESLLTEEQLELESYERRRQQLEEFLILRPEMQAKHDQILQDLNRKHQERMAEIDVYQYGTRAQKLEAFMGDMANILSAGGDKMVKVAAVLGAAQAWISTLIGAAKELEKGVLGFATAAAVIAKGVAFVTAIKAAGSSGNAGASAAGGGGAATASQPQAPQRPAVSLTLIGEQGFTRAQILQIATALNDSADDGTLPINIRGAR